MSSLETAIDFGSTGNSRNYVVDGFGDPEGGHTWTVGPLSLLRLPIRKPGKPHVNVFRVRPFIAEPKILKQAVRFAVGAQVIASFIIQREVVFALRVPDEMTKENHIVISIFHEDSEASRAADTYRDGRSMGLMLLSLWLFGETTRPVKRAKTLPPLHFALQSRPLETAFKEAAGTDLETLAMAFESLGHRCAFGLFQQRFGAHPLGLLRFAGISPQD